MEPRNVKHNNGNRLMKGKIHFSLKLLLFFVISTSIAIIALPKVTYEYDKNETVSSILYQNLTNTDSESQEMVETEEDFVQYGRTVLPKKVNAPQVAQATPETQNSVKPAKTAKPVVPIVKEKPPVTTPVQVEEPKKEIEDKPKSDVIVVETPLATEYKTMDLRLPSKVTAEEINTYIAKYEKQTGKKSVFSGRGQLLIDAATDVGMNQLIFAALAIHESAYGTSSLSHWKYNVMSIKAFTDTAYDSSLKFSNIDQAIRYTAYYIKSLYLSPTAPAGHWSRFKGYTLGDKTTGMNFYYAADPNWGTKIASHANLIHPFNPEEYTGISLMTGKISSVSLTDFYDSFEDMNIVAVANSTINLYTSREDGTVFKDSPTKTSAGGKAPVGAIPAGESFQVLGKYNNHWFKVRYGTNTYYFLVNLSSYKTYFSITNLMRSPDNVYMEQKDVLPSGYTTVYR